MDPLQPATPVEDGGARNPTGEASTTAGQTARERHLVTGQPAGAAAHGDRARLPRARTIALVAGCAALLTAAVAGVAMLLRPAASVPTKATSMQFVTVTSAPRPVPLSGPEILALLAVPPDLGPLADPQRLAACMTALGRPAAGPVLGGRPVDVDGVSGVLVLLPGQGPTTVDALVVAPTCGGANSGLLARSAVRRP